jgi:lipopolysaccharide transport system permease protein
MSDTVCDPPLGSRHTPGQPQDGNPTGGSASRIEIVLEAGRQDRHYWLDLWRYRELFKMLAWRDVLVRYKQTVIGTLWALFRPLITMVVFTIIFGRIARLPSNDAPYALMVFAGLLPWALFSTALTDASNSLVNSANLISKIYFPRIIVPTAAVVVSLVDFLVSLMILAILMVAYRYALSWTIVFLPCFIAMAFFASLGPSLWITALNVKYRDFRYIIPFIVQLGLYASPVGFSSRVVPEQWRSLYSLNPMVGVIDGFRWCILGPGQGLDIISVLIGAAVTTVFAAFGIYYFRRTERSFADLV